MLQTLKDGAATIDRREYVRDSNGNITLRDTTPELGVYGYDTLDRLTFDSIDQSDQEIIYDENGNRLSRNSPGEQSDVYQYAASSNRLTGLSSLKQMGPLPDSPTSRTQASLAAIRSIRSRSSRMR